MERWLKRQDGLVTWAGNQGMSVFFNNLLRMFFCSWRIKRNGGWSCRFSIYGYCYSRGNTLLLIEINLLGHTIRIQVPRAVAVVRGRMGRQDSGWPTSWLPHTSSIRGNNGECGARIFSNLQHPDGELHGGAPAGEDLEARAQNPAGTRKTSFKSPAHFPRKQ